LLLNRYHSWMAPKMRYVSVTPIRHVSGKILTNIHCYISDVAGVVSLASVS
jgi:hypothetical protein